MPETNSNFEPMQRRSLADVAIAKIDTFFQLDAQMSEEDKLIDGLKWATEHNFMSVDEAELCLQAFVAGRASSQNEAAHSSAETVS